MRAAYVVKRYPRFSETFIVNEILAHEAAGLDVDIFALRPSLDVRFQEEIGRVRAPVTYLESGAGKASGLWERIREAARVLPGFLEKLEHATPEDARTVCQAADLAIQCRARQVDHMHAHFATSAASVARLASVFTGIPFTLTAHAKDIFHEDVDPEDLSRKLRGAYRTITVSDHNVAHLRAAYPGDADGVVRIYNGLDLSVFAPRWHERDESVIVAVGRLVEKKGLADLIDACAILKDRGRKLRCRIIGDGEEREALSARISQCDVSDTVELTGPLPRTQVATQLARAALLVAPCVTGRDGNRDGLPTVLIEAMALGTPCLSTKVTGIPEIVRDGETGRLVDERSPHQLADAIEAMLNDPKGAFRLAQAARRLVETEFDVERSARRLRGIFSHAVDRTEP